MQTELRARFPEQAAQNLRPLGALAAPKHAAPNVERNPSKFGEYYMELPRGGRRAWAWFSFLKAQNVCVFLDEGGNILFYEKVAYSKLNWGTLLSGTLKRQSGGRPSSFVADNVALYKGKSVGGGAMGALTVLRDIMKSPPHVLPAVSV